MTGVTERHQAVQVEVRAPQGSLPHVMNFETGPDPTGLAEADRLLPHPEDTDRFVRYEAHVSRQFYQALHELEGHQERRQGQVAPLVRVDVQGLAEG